MAYQQVALELLRDGACTPWGFRMTGGADIGAPLVVQKVTFGSPAENELHKGDIILKVRDKDAARLSHQVATDLITKAGSTLRLVVARNMGGHIPRGISVPGVTAGVTAPPMMMNGPQNLFKPLPTTNFGGQRQRRTSTESFTSTTSSDTEKDLIVNQPYRSTPLILPSAKSSKDIPVGSYLRHDPLTKTAIPPNMGLRDPYMLSKVQEAILEAAQTSSGYSSPGRTPTPDMGYQNGPQVCNKQYNSPINMYSNQAIVEALAAQSVSNRMPQVHHMEAMELKKVPITESPTYQLIHEEEWKRGKVSEHEALKEHVYNVIPQGTGDKLEIHQSGSFKSIMHDLRGISDF